ARPLLDVGDACRVARVATGRKNSRLARRRYCDGLRLSLQIQRRLRNYLLRDFFRALAISANSFAKTRPVARAWNFSDLHAARRAVEFPTQLDNRHTRRKQCRC